MRGKFTQVNEFLKLLEHCGALQWSHGGVRRESPSGSRAGGPGGGGGSPRGACACWTGPVAPPCLSFFAYHYLNDVRHIPATLVGWTA